MAALFADLPEALENTIEVARRCSLHVEDPRTDPAALTGASDDPEEAERAEVESCAAGGGGLEGRLAKLGMAPGYREEDYRERLAFELGVIRADEVSGLLPHRCGPSSMGQGNMTFRSGGPGLGAGSAGRLCPDDHRRRRLRFSLLSSASSIPNACRCPISTSISADRREEVIRYVQQKYGREQVAQIITFGSRQARAALRDVGRVAEMPLRPGRQDLQLVPNNPANRRAFQGDRGGTAPAGGGGEGAGRCPPPRHCAEDRGALRHASTNAAGMSIGDRPLSQLVPMYRDPRFRHAGHPVQHEMGRAGGSREVRLPWPEDADGFEDGRRLRRQARIHIDLASIPLGRSEDLRDPFARDGRRVPGGKPPACERR